MCHELQRYPETYRVNPIGALHTYSKCFYVLKDTQCHCKSAEKTVKAREVDRLHKEMLL